MGCDIHLYREKKVNGKWISFDDWSDPYDEGMDVAYDDRAYTSRDYNFFGLISKGVRRDFDFALPGKGFPADADPEVENAYKRWDSDAHSASYLTLQELYDLRAILKSISMPMSGMIQQEQFEAFKATIKAGEPDYELLYPHCGSTNSPGWIDFKVEVPGLWGFESSLTEVIKALEPNDMDTALSTQPLYITGPDDLRVVFWFDN